MIPEGGSTMQEYRADRAAGYLLCVCVCLAAGLLSGAAYLFLRRWAFVMYLCIGIFCTLAFLTGFVLTPLYFRSLRCIVTPHQITCRSGILLHREKSVRMRTIQYVQIVTGPFDGALGLNFIVLHVYGGSMQLFFLRRRDRREIARLLSQRGVFHAS